VDALVEFRPDGVFSDFAPSSCFCISEPFIGFGSIFVHTWITQTGQIALVEGNEAGDARRRDIFNIGVQATVS
jgi:hypothetical protein